MIFSETFRSTYHLQSRSLFAPLIHAGLHESSTVRSKLPAHQKHLVTQYHEISNHYTRGTLTTALAEPIFLRWIGKLGLRQPRICPPRIASHALASDLRLYFRSCFRNHSNNFTIIIPPEKQACISKGLQRSSKYLSGASSYLTKAPDAVDVTSFCTDPIRYDTALASYDLNRSSASNSTKDIHDGKARLKRITINRMIMKKQRRGKRDGRNVPNQYFDSDLETRICTKK